MPARVLATVERPVGEKLARARPQRFDMGGVLFHPLFCKCRRRAEPGNQRRAERPGAQAVFLPAAGLDFDEFDAVAQPQRTHSLGSVKLVRGNRDHVRPGHLLLAIGLHSVAQIERACALGLTLPIDGRLDRPDLVIDLHDADQPGVAGQILPRIALPLGRDIQNMTPIERTGCIEHRGMFDRGNRNAARVTHAADGEVDRLGCTAGENDPPTRRHQRSHLVARDFDRGRSHPPHAVRAVRIAEAGALRSVEPTQHRIARLGRERGTGLVVEIDHVSTWSASVTLQLLMLSLSKRRFARDIQ